MEKEPDETLLWTPPTEPLPGVPRWKVKLMWLLATVTPLRWRPVRRLALDSARARARSRRRRLEARGDASLSRPAMFAMDVRIGELLGENGYFVEAGANDGYLQSNTYYLERFLGWRGLLIEPLPALAAQARKNRPASQVVTAALAGRDVPGSTLRMKEAGLVSVVSGAQGSEAADREHVRLAFARGEVDIREVNVPARTLSEILEEAGAPEIDLLSLDVEGYETQALEGLDLERHAPRWILVETTTERRRAAIAAILGDRYTYVERFSELDDLYRRADVDDPRTA